MKYDDFIYVADNAFNSVACKETIDFFERIFASGPSSIHKRHGENDFPEREMGRKDKQIFAEQFDPLVAKTINQTLDIHIQKYADEFFVFKEVVASSMNCKIQKTEPRGGYHLWHCENGDNLTARRVLSWIMYLNDMPDGEGETEFLWQKRRITAKQGRLVIFPAAFTHVHRGNPPLTADKYIATGWYEYMR